MFEVIYYYMISKKSMLKFCILFFCIFHISVAALDPQLFLKKLQEPTPEWMKDKECSYEYIKGEIEKLFDGYSMHYLIPSNVNSRAKLLIIPR